jgi:hypothetical protein
MVLAKANAESTLTLIVLAKVKEPCAKILAELALENAASAVIFAVFAIAWGVFALSNAACARTLAEFALPNAKFAVEKAIGATLSILWSIADSVTCFVVNTPLLLSTTTKTVFSVFASGDVNKGRSVILIVVDISVPMILLKE